MIRHRVVRQIAALALAVGMVGGAAACRAQVEQPAGAGTSTTVTTFDVVPGVVYTATTDTPDGPVAISGVCVGKGC